MDSSIRQLLSLAQRNGGSKKNAALKEAYEALRHVAETKPTVDGPESFGQDLYVQCAEIAFQYGMPSMAKECLKMFFMKTPATNQFLCRAYLCQAQLLAPQTAASPEQLDKAVVYLVKAISFAKENARYHFLVYNASVLYWQFCRPFLKPNYRQYLARSLHQVVKALDDIDDKDYEWRAMLMIALIECHLDAGRRSDASHIATAAASFIRHNVPQLYKQVFGLMVRNQLVESAKLVKDLKNPELAVYYKICKLKLSLDQGESSEYHLDIEQILYQLGAITEEPKLTPEPRSRSKGRSSTTPSTGKSPPAGDEESKERPHLLLEVGRLCLDLDFADLARICADQMKNSVVKDPGFYLEAEFLQIQLMVKQLGDKQENYMKSSVDVRLQAIKRCEEAIMNAIRQGNPNIIQVGCTTQWNLCLPLLQSNLRQHARKPLTQVAEALEEVDSLLIQLRCQVHTELAKCEEDAEQIEVAMGHLKKALQFDDGCVYQERLQVSLKRLQLRAQLYSQPERPEDQAAMIIEQARKADSGTIRMKRSLLVRAGEALAPDAFLLVLDSESDTKEETTGKGPVTVIKKLAGKARHFLNCIKKADGHLKRLGDENDRERARLWADLAKTARKQEVWDVCRVAARFCLLYDDGRWKNVPPTKIESPKHTRSKTEIINADGELTSSQSQMSVLDDKRPGSRHGSRPGTPEPVVPLYDKDLIRMLAEVNFINGEAQVHLLRSEGIQLNDKPIPPEDKSKRPKGYVAKRPEEDPDWLEYCDWIDSLSERSTKAFIRGLELGIQLQEPWVVCSAGAYIWNYNNHVLTQNRHQEVVEDLQICLDGLKKVGHAGETMLLMNICNSLAFAYLKPWIPSRAKETPEVVPSLAAQAEKGKKTPAAPATGKAKSAPISVSPDAGPDLKKAIEVCEYAMQVTNGDKPVDVVPISIRMPLLQTWVQAKQMAQQQINKNFGTDDEINIEGQRPMTRSIVSVEMIQLNKNGLMEFKDAPTLPEVAQMMEDCTFDDKFIELQLWTRLTSLSYEQKLPNLVNRCSKQALKFASVGTQPKSRKIDPHKYVVEQEMFSYASGLLGQCLMQSMQGKNNIRREAMQAFLDSARYARDAKNYEMVMTASRHYWNAIIPLVGQPIERELVKEPIKSLLQYINDTTEKKTKKEEQDDSDEEGEPDQPVGSEVKDEVKQQDVGTSIGSPEDDLTLRAALYGVLFQSYADQGQWEESLKAMDQAVSDMPRTKHRLLIFKHRVIVKAKLGRHVYMDIAKFKDESEDFVSHMWRRVALCSVDTLDQLKSYQYAIEALDSSTSEWQKIDYLTEFGQWLYVNQFPLDDAVDVIEWAVDIILNMQAASSVDPNAKKEKKKGKVSARGKRSKSPAQQQVKQSVNQSDAKKEKRGEDGEINAADYIPVAKKTLIGVMPASDSLTLQDISDVKQLDTLIRTHVLLAEISGHGSSNHRNYCLMAYGYLMRLWQLAIPASGPVIKELARNPQEESGKNSAKGKKKDPKDKEVPKEKPKRKFPIDVMPGSIEDWASYDIPDEMVEAFKQESMKKTGINETTVTKPLLTLYYVDMLVKQLHQLGFSHMTLPILAFEELLSKDLIKNKPLNMLVHLKAMEVCLELNLKNAANFHEKLVGDISISEDDQARSREEVALWKEKQIQVSREEMKVKASLARIAEEQNACVSAHSKTNLTIRNTKSPNKADRDSSKLEDGSPKEVVDSHLGKILGTLTTRDIWTDIAGVLLGQGMYQRAREYLSEAHTEAVAFEDRPLQSKILALLARLAITECQYGQATAFCMTAQEIHKGDEMFWFETILVILDSTMADFHDRNRKRKARSLVVRTMNVFLNILDEKPNRASTIGYILARLEAKLGSIQLSITREDYKDPNIPKVMRALLSACQKFENATEKLLRLGFKRDAMSIMKEHGDVLIQLARAALEREIQHTYYLQALAILKDIVALSQEVLYDAQTLSPILELRNVSLPVQRELVEHQLICGELMLEIYCRQVTEERSKQLDDQRKGTVLKMVEDLVRETPNYTQMEREWVEIAEVISESCLIQLVSAHNLSGQISTLKARSLYSIGRCLRLLSTQKSADPPSQWLVNEMEMIKLTEQAEEGLEEDSESMKIDEDEKRQLYNKYSDQINDVLEKQTASNQYLNQATECLAQALTLSLNKGYKDLAGKAALELVECCGQFDPASASQFLALFQSCEVAMYMEKVLYKAQPDPTLSRLAALIHQRASLLSNDVVTNSSQGSVAASIEKALEEDWQAWKRLSILPNHLDILKEFPSNFNFFILQHSPDKTKLYGAIMDKPKGVSVANTAATGKTDSKKQPPQVGGRARVIATDTNPQYLEELIERFRSHKHSTQQFLLQQEYIRTQQAQRNKMLENLDDSMKQDTKSATPESLSEEMDLQEEFLELVTAMENYLRPVLSTLDVLVRPQTSTTTSNTNLNKEPSPSQECVIMLADPLLMEMPLEALQMLQSDNVMSLSRDFSLQFFYHRYHVDVPDDPAVSGKKPKADKGREIPSRIPGLKDASKKQAKIVPLNRQLLPWCQPVDTMNFRYMVDPYLDCAETETHAPIETTKKILDEYEQQFTPRWIGIMGDEHVPSVGEWEIYLTESSSFIYYGMEGLLSNIPPGKISSLNIPDCMIAYILDMAQTSNSFLRQSKIDVLKDSNILSLEKPVEKVLLVSLSGVKCVMANQWHCTLEENQAKFKTSMKDMLTEGLSIGQAARLLCTPYRRKVETEEGEGEGEHKEKVAGSERGESVAGSQQEQGEDQEEPTDEPLPNQSWFNMVCYGLPNLVITQV